MKRGHGGVKHDRTISKRGFRWSGSSVDRVTAERDADAPAPTQRSSATGEHSPSEQWTPSGVSLGGSLRETARRQSVYDVVGGQDFFDALVDRFYDLVEADPLLRPMYPEDLEPSRTRLAGFLAQYWGGPARYSEQRGHPRLRMRHMGFAIAQRERDAWMTHMAASLEAATVADGSNRPLPEQIEKMMLDYFDNAATHLINRPR